MPAFTSLLTGWMIVALAVSGVLKAATQDAQVASAEPQSGVTPAGAGPETVNKWCPRCKRQGRLVCADDGKTYRNACFANCAKARMLHFGWCQCSAPAANCQALGQDCLLGQQRSTSAAHSVPLGDCNCCKGLICWAGPVVRVGQVLGRCLNETGPLPIG